MNYQIRVLFALLIFASGCGEGTGEEQGRAGLTRDFGFDFQDSATQVPDWQHGPDSDPSLNSDEARLDDAGAKDGGSSSSSCEPLTARCTDNQRGRVICTANGEGERIEACAMGTVCDEGECIDQACTPTQLGCLNHTVRRCDAQGLGFLDAVVDDCAAMGLECDDGRCIDGVEDSRGRTCGTINCLEMRTADLVCQRFRRDLHNVPSTAFERGDEQCDPGQLPPNAYDAALVLANYARWLSGLPEIGYDDALNGPAQACATMMSAQGALSHQPGANWACYRAEGADSAGSSNITLMQRNADIEGAIMNFLHDGGDNNRADVGHRRWILSPTLSAMGFGYHQSENARFAGACQDVISAPAGPLAGPPFIGYPGPGVFPIELIQSRFWRLPWSVHLDRPYRAAWAPIEQWTIQLWRVDADGDVPIETDFPSASGRWYGRNQAIVFTPAIDISPGQYRVQVNGPQGDFEYTTELVNCL